MQQLLLLLGREISIRNSYALYEFDRIMLARERERERRRGRPILFVLFLSSNAEQAESSWLTWELRTYECTYDECIACTDTYDHSGSEREREI